MCKNSWPGMKVHVLMFLFFPGIIHPQNAPMAHWQDLTQHLAEAQVLSGGDLMAEVIDLKTGASKAYWQPKKSASPASTLKLLYTLAAFDQLGPTFRFETHFSYAGRILADGSLEGNLIIKASGDPSLGSDRFGEAKDLPHLLDAIYTKLKAAGITCIDGDILLLLPYTHYPVSGEWPWEDIGNYYGAGDFGFNVRENSIDVWLKRSDREGNHCPVGKTEPNVPGMRMNSKVITAGTGSGDRAYIYGAPGQYQRLIQGTIPAGKGDFRIRGSLPDPPSDFLRILRQYLEDKGVYSEGIKVSSRYEKPTKTIGVIRSNPLPELLRACNDYSINLYSEAIGKKLLSGKVNRLTGAYPSESDWERIFEQYDLPIGKLAIRDACGLSPNNAISPAQMNAFLREMVGKLGINQVLDLLPQAGKDGAAKNLPFKDQWKDRLWIKSGYIKGSLNYAGIFRAEADGRYYAFSIFTRTSDHKTAELKKALIGYIKALIEEPGQQGK